MSWRGFCADGKAERGNIVNYQDYYEVVCSPIGVADKVQKWQNRLVTGVNGAIAAFFFKQKLGKYKK